MQPTYRDRKGKADSAPFCSPTHGKKTLSQNVQYIQGIFEVHPQPFEYYLHIKQTIFDIYQNAKKKKREREKRKIYNNNDNNDLKIVL